MPAPEDAGEHAEALQRILNRFPQDWPAYIGVGRGWYPILADLDARLSGIDPDYEVHQIKEKFGGLRYYIGNGSPEMHDLIHEAESRSYTVCEATGGPGTLVQRGGWLKTLDPEAHPGYTVVSGR